MVMDLNYQAMKAAKTINAMKKPFWAKAEDNVITVKWRWKHAADFNIPAAAVTEEIREFKYIVTLFESGKYKATSQSTAASAGVSGGKFSFGKQVQLGKQVNIHKEISFGRNHETGHTGINTYSFDSRELTDTVKQVLTEMGLKKKGLF